MKQLNFIKGREGEEKAVKFLKNKGYRILERNWHTRFGEIDIICEKDKILVFVEVKTKTSDQFGEPWEMVNAHKIKQIQMTGEAYLQKFPIFNNQFPMKRIDIIGVYPGKIEHWENV
ncbi:MAG: YraN family protein [Candidatus Beckwithbacteria bacterium]|nr:YraN family protein [Candidatus Beckwithbacteria bacterium]